MNRSKPTTTTKAPDRIAEVIRTRRNQLDWSLAKLAVAAGLRSPSYVFHIENGTKAPSVAVARRLAAALGLDPELLAAWARTRHRSDLGTALDASETVRHWLGRSRVEEAPAEESRPMTPTTAGREGPASRSLSHDASSAEPPLHASSAESDVAEFVAITVLAEGDDPTREPVASRAIETVRIARALLPPVGAEARLVGYRLSAHGARRMPDALHAGDCVIVLLDAEPPGPDAPCAVRLGGRVEIARVRMRDGVAHLPAPASANDSEHSDVVLGPAGGAIVGRVVVAFRRWL
jgi:transcriptional regulator with XRE-family HTH domain